MAKKTKICLLFFILFVASFFRLWQLKSIPPGLYPDEAINANEAYLFPGKIFYPENNGREGLFINLVFLSFKIFGTSTFSLRFVSVFFGVLTVLGLYLFSKEIFYHLGEEKRDIVSLLASFFLATSFWHTNFSRIGFRGILLPFVLTFWLYFLLLGYRRQKGWAIILSGIFFGLGFYTYSSFRLGVFFLLAIWLYLLVIGRRKNLKQFIILSAKFLLPTFLVALPLGIYFLYHPQDFFGRLGPISIFSQKDFISAFRESLFKHLLMFNFAGDRNWRHNISGAPQLFWPIGILFLVGILIFVNRFFVFLEEKNKRAFFYFIPLFGFFVFLLPGILTYEGIPHSLRTIGTIPFVYIFVGFAALWVYEKIRKILTQYKFAPLFLKTLAIVFLLFVLSNQANRYFILFAKNENVKGAFCKNFVQMGEYLTSFEEDVKRYVIVNEDGVPVSWLNGIPMPAQTLVFEEISKYGEIRAVYLKPEDVDKIKAEKRSLILLMKEDETILEQLKKQYPQGKIKKDYPIISFEIL
ncbi:glycosyltransferase family 39 protein [bacterium]|nr:glycosyltransferase family 39 protein [bacterium]